MSAIDASCYPIPQEKETGAGEMNCCKSMSGDESNSTNLIVSEIMNDIVDNAFEVIMAKSLQQPLKVEKISPNVVGDILENILSPSTKSGMSHENYRQDETILLDDEIKRIIKEMKCPPEPKNIICTQGVGDQLGDKREVTPDKVLAEPPKRNTLERKNRLTNLVRNSKQMLAKFVTSDDENELKRIKSEEMHEKLLKVIDLETPGNPGNFQTAGSSKTAPGILQLPSESLMDMVDLEGKINEFTKQDKERDNKDTSDGSDGKLENKKGIQVTRKRWNIGSKILKYIKKHNRKE